MKSHNIKSILEERSMEVSENSWEKLSNQLDAYDRKKKRTRFYPYAACLALLVGFILFMLLKTETRLGTETIVKTETKANNHSPKSASQREIILKENENVSIKTEEVVEQESTVKVVDNELIKNKSASKGENKLEVELHKEIQNTVAIAQKENSAKEIETIITQKEKIVDPNAELKASIAALSASEKIMITDEEINELLKEAQQSLKKIAVQKEINSTKFATADELLEEVELELDQSFKQKVFELIKTNLQKTRTVVADRD